FDDFIGEVAGDGFRCRHFAFELGHFLIQIFAIVRRKNLREQSIDIRQVDNHARDRINFAFKKSFEFVVVSVTMGREAAAELFSVALLAPRADLIAVRALKTFAAGEASETHKLMPPSTVSVAPVVHFDAAESKNAQASAMSRGLPNSPSG